MLVKADWKLFNQYDIKMLSAFFIQELKTYICVRWIQRLRVELNLFFTTNLLTLAMYQRIFPYSENSIFDYVKYIGIRGFILLEYSHIDWIQKYYRIQAEYEYAQPPFTCSRSTIETSEQSMKCVQSWQ